MRVGYQGIEGSYSEVALLSHFNKKVKPVGYPTFEAVFEAVKKGVVTYGLIPVDNTISGSVAENYDLLIHEDLIIIAEVFLKIRHTLLAAIGSNFRDIKKVYSHPVALAQCKKFLKKHNIAIQQFYDTAGAAKMIGESKDKEQAAIASGLCAELYSLQTVKKDIQENDNNITRFLVVVKKENVPKNVQKEKTSIVFKVKHRPGALLDCLQRLSKNNVNLTKLESRPNPGNPWEYIFYVDFEGGQEDDNVQLSLSEMEAASLFVKVLGSYAKGKTY